jgi:hypothetical protein
MKPRERLREIRRAEPDGIELITLDGTVVTLHGHGVDLAEKIRTRERAFRLLTDALHDAPVSSGDSPRDWQL